MSTQSHLSLVNVAPDSILLGHAVVGLALAHAATREHLAGGIESFHFERTGGVVLRVADAGVRQHLANALGLDKSVDESRTKEGTVYIRTGFHLGVPVQVWNLEP